MRNMHVHSAANNIMRQRRHSGLVRTLAIGSFAGFLAIATQLVSTEAQEGDNSRRQRLLNRIRTTESDASTAIDRGQLEIELENDGGPSTGQKPISPRLLLKGQTAVSARRMHDNYHEDEFDEEDGSTADRLLARTTMRKKQSSNGNNKGHNKKANNVNTAKNTKKNKHKGQGKKNHNKQNNHNKQKNHSKENNHSKQKQKTSSGQAKNTNVDVDVNVDVDLDVNLQDYVPAVTKHGGHPPGFNKHGVSSPAPPKMTKKTGSKVGKTKRGTNHEKMCPCPDPYGFQPYGPSYIPMGGNGGTMAKYSIEMADGSVGDDPVNPVLSGGKDERKRSGGEAVRALQYGGNLPNQVWWAPSEWQTPMCPCPTDAPTYFPTYYPTPTTDAPTAISVPTTDALTTDVPTVPLPTDTPTFMPTALSDGGGTLLSSPTRDVMFIVAFVVS